MTRVVPSVADDDQHLLLQCGPAQMRQSRRERVVQCRPAVRRHAVERGRKLRRTGREETRVRQTQGGAFIEINDEHLVLRVTGAGKGQRCGGDFFAFAAHAAAVIHDQPYRCRHVFVLKDPNRLRHSVFEHLEAASFEPGGESASAVAHGRPQRHQFTSTEMVGFSAGIHGGAAGRCSARRKKSGRAVRRMGPPGAFLIDSEPPAAAGLLTCPLSQPPRRTGAGPPPRATAGQSDRLEADCWQWPAAWLRPAWLGEV